MEGKNRIKKILKIIGKSQTWLASELDISKQYMSDLCNNRTPLSFARAYEIANILECSVHDLIAPNEFQSILIVDDFEVNKSNLEQKIDTLQNTVEQQSELINELKEEVKKLAK